MTPSVEQIREGIDRVMSEDCCRNQVLKLKSAVQRDNALDGTVSELAQRALSGYGAS
jgi:hypothetical protein